MAQVTEVIQGEPDGDEAAAAAAALVAEQQGEDTTAGGEGEDTVDGGAGEGETLVVTIGDAKPAEEDENLNFKQLRDNRRELARENRELKRQIEATRGTTQTEALGQKPKLEDFQYDQDAYDAAHEKYILKKAATEAEARKAEEAKAKADADWQAEQQGYEKEREAFKTRAPDFDDADATIAEKLSTTQRGIIIHASKNRATLVYALFKNPAKLEELAKITDPVKFTWELSQIEGAIKVTTTTRHQPEERISGVLSTGKGGDAHLEKLRAEAARNGDHTKVHAYKRAKAQKAAKAA